MLLAAVAESRDFLWRFRDPNRVPRISNQVRTIRENYHQVSRIRENRVHASPYLVSTLFLKKTCWRMLGCISFSLFS